VLLDATIVRSVLVPAAMRLLGDVNWWFPRWLRWLPDLRVEAGERSGQAIAVAEPEPDTTPGPDHNLVAATESD
jgi:uncharacterized membrane protein YdfJ with MMPL/SSD domain